MTNLQTSTLKVFAMTHSSKPHRDFARALQAALDGTGQFELARRG